MGSKARSYRAFGAETEVQTLASGKAKADPRVQPARALNRAPAERAHFVSRFSMRR